jgi:hypothetical protein
MDAISKHVNPEEFISSEIHKQSHARPLAQANPRKLARLNSVSGHHASDWLHVIPCAQLGLKMSSHRVYQIPEVPPLPVLWGTHGGF